jgi:D-alanine-D-alanine ligase-like ATP-grasp enzyme
MTGDYESLSAFVRKVIVDPGLTFNSVKTTQSTVKGIVDGFESLGWASAKVHNPRSSHPRHRLVSPDGSIELSMSSAKVFRHPMHTEQICQRKHLTKRMLEFDKLPTPAGADFSPKERNVARAFFEKVPKPVVMKPTNSGGSHGVTVGVSDVSEFEAAWKFALDEGRSDSNVLIEQFVRGVELRALVVGEDVVSIVARVQPFVVGDGTARLESLIEDANEARKVHYRATQLPVVIDWDFIGKRGHDAMTVPAAGEIVYLNPFGLPAYGAFLVDVTDSVSPAIRELAVRAKNAIPDLEMGGIDILVEDLDDVDTAVILEVNTAPSLNLHRYVTHGPAREVHLALVDYFHGQFLKESRAS